MGGKEKGEGRAGKGQGMEEDGEVRGGEGEGKWPPKYFGPEPPLRFPINETPSVKGLFTAREAN